MIRESVLEMESVKNGAIKLPTVADSNRADFRSEYFGEDSEPEKAGLPEPVARLLSELQNHHRNDRNELLLFRFLCRLGTLLLCGPTGIGKSSLALQFAILWAIARDCFGIAPARPLKSLIVQAENDDGDIAEMRDGVIAGLGLSAEEKKAACDNILIVREDERTGIAFLHETVRRLLAEHKPDLLWIDPALSFLGGESNSQKDVGGFLRNGLNPLLREFNCGCVIVHHTNKPASGKEKPQWSAGDFAYLGSGSAEWANHARAVLALRSIGSHNVFELQAGKRGSRLGWRESDGQTKAFAKYLAHAKEPGVICWREVTADELDTGGRPKNQHGDDMLSVLPAGELTSTEWQKLSKQECGISERSFFRERKALEKAERIFKSVVSAKWQPIQK